jgi:hypothetical protein
MHRPLTGCRPWASEVPPAPDAPARDRRVQVGGHASHQRAVGETACAVGVGGHRRQVASMTRWPGPHARHRANADRDGAGYARTGVGQPGSLGEGDRQPQRLASNTRSHSPSTATSPTGGCHQTAGHSGDQADGGGQNSGLPPGGRIVDRSATTTTADQSGGRTPLPIPPRPPLGRRQLANGGRRWSEHIATRKGQRRMVVRTNGLIGGGAPPGTRTPDPQIMSGTHTESTTWPFDGPHSGRQPQLWFRRP